MVLHSLVIDVLLATRRRVHVPQVVRPMVKLLYMYGFVETVDTFRFFRETVFQLW